MVTLTFVFWMFVMLFGVIGAMRGWAKELLVSFSVILSIFIIIVMERFVPFFSAILTQSEPQVQFWTRALVIILFAFFGYQTPNFRNLGGARFARERLQDTLLGLFLGAVNGYLLVGTLWYYLNITGYPVPLVISPQEAINLGIRPEEMAQVQELIEVMPPRLLGVPTIYFAVAVAFAFVVIVFV